VQAGASNGLHVNNLFQVIDVWGYIIVEVRRLRFQRPFERHALNAF
jgi:hypothetical protein